MSMRISKFFPITGLGLDGHMVLPPSVPPPPPAPPNPAPIPRHVWGVMLINHLSAGLFGKFTVTKTVTEGMGNILWGYDWGMGQLHIPYVPIVATPSMAVTAIGASHKYWMPSFSVQEEPEGGVLAMGSSATPVAVSTPAYLISLQDCNDINGIGFNAPTGIGFQVPSTEYVGFNFGDFAAGAIGMAVDSAVSAINGKFGGAATSKPAGQAAVAVGMNTVATASANQGPLATVVVGCVAGPAAPGVFIAGLGGMLATSVGTEYGSKPSDSNVQQSD